MKYDRKMTVLLFAVALISVILFFTNFQDKEVQVSHLDFYDVNGTHITIEYKVKNNNDYDGKCLSQVSLSGDTNKKFQKELGIIHSNEKIDDIILTESWGKTKVHVNVTCVWIT